MVSIDVANAFNTVPWEKLETHWDIWTHHISSTIAKRLPTREESTDRRRQHWSDLWSSASVGHWSHSMEHVLWWPIGPSVPWRNRDGSVRWRYCGSRNRKYTNLLETEINDTLLKKSKRRYELSQFILKGETLDLKEHIRYLGVELSAKLGFKDHINIIRTKPTKTTTALARLMPNVAGPTVIKRKLLASVVNSQLLYAAPVWCSSLK